MNVEEINPEIGTRTPNSKLKTQELSDKRNRTYGKRNLQQCTRAVYDDDNDDDETMMTIMTKDACAAEM